MDNSITAAIMMLLSALASVPALADTASDATMAEPTTIQPPAAEPAATPQPCSKGVHKIATDMFAMISASQPDEEMLNSASAYVVSCVNVANSFSSSERDAFIRQMRESVDKLDRVILSLQLEMVKSASNKNAIQQKIDTLEKYRTQLELALVALDKKPPLDKGWAKDFVANFYLGYEGTSVSGFNEKGTARTGMMIYNQATGPFTEDSKYGVHVFGNILLTSSGEQTKSAAATDIKTAFEMDINTFFPFLVRRQSLGLLTGGPILSFGLKKVDGDNEFNKQYYLGCRFAHSPESYFDVLYGKNEGVGGKRVVLKGQIPITEIMDGNVFVGGFANFGVSDAPPDNADTLKLYVTWQVRFTSIVGNPE